MHTPFRFDQVLSKEADLFPTLEAFAAARGRNHWVLNANDSYRENSKLQRASWHHGTSGFANDIILDLVARLERVGGRYSSTSVHFESLSNLSISGVVRACLPCEENVAPCKDALIASRRSPAAAPMTWDLNFAPSSSSESQENRQRIAGGIATLKL